MSITKTQSTLERYTNAHGAPGFEDEVSAHLAHDLQDWGDIDYDRNGSIAVSRGSGLHIMVAAHMDEVGFRVQSITSDGFIKFVPVGGWWAHTLLSQRVLIKTEQEHILGVIGSKPVHFLPASERTKVQELANMFIDVGATTREEVLAMGIELGSPIVPDTQFTPLANNERFLAKAFDNRVGCAALPLISETLRRDLGSKVTLCATVQEEVGLRGGKTLSHKLQPDIAIILEGSPADDTPGFNLADSQGVIGKGVQIRLHDPSAIVNPRFAKFAQKVAKEAGIKHQIAVRTSGGTDAGAVAYSGQGVPTIVMGVPARYIHSHNSIIEASDFEAMVNLATSLIEALSDNGGF